MEAYKQEFNEFMAQYADTMTKMNNLGNNAQTEEETKYFIEVQTRINEKLLEVVE